MITVRWEFVGDQWDMAAAQRAVDRIQSRFQRALGGIRCSQHGSGPLLVVRGQSLGELELDLETCCQQLVDEANARIQSGKPSARAFGPNKQKRRATRADRRRPSRSELPSTSYPAS